MTEFGIVEVLAKLIPYIISLVIGGIGGWKLVKRKLNEIVEAAQKLAEFLVILKTAIEDEAVSESEFQHVWASGFETIKEFGDVIGIDLTQFVLKKKRK